MLISRSLAAARLLLLAVLPGFVSPLYAQFPRVTYEVGPGSTLSDGCRDCERPEIQHAVTGTFVLQRLPVRIVGELYELTELQLSCLDSTQGCDFKVTGGGNYHLRTPETQTTGLTLSINGVEGIVLGNDSVAVSTPWPVVDFTITEDGNRDPLHVYTLRLVAAPRVERVRYELVPGNLDDFTGSIVSRICPACRLLDHTIAVSGTFELGLMAATVDGLDVYFVDNVVISDVRPRPQALDLEFRGAGTYEEGGDAEIVKQMRLSLSLNGDPLRIYSSGPVVVAPGETFPVISIDIVEEIQEALWHNIRLLARPAKSSVAKFRRGDSNADEAVDIADSVFSLLSLFAGGPAPWCLDAADANASGKLDLSDAVHGLAYLFLGGPEPPAPGPLTCGEAPTTKLGCQFYPACDG